MSKPLQPTLADIDQWLDAEFADAGVAIAIISEGQTRFYLHGLANNQQNQAVSNKTLFEIGSVTKPLVGLLTALAVNNQQLSVNSTIASLLKDPVYQHHQYSIANLLSHTSGLPRLPANLPLSDLTDPYANYTHADLMQALQQVKTGEQQFEYSNFGFGLLAEIVSQQQNSSFAALLQQQVFQPLGMADSAVAITNGRYPKRAKGYHIDGSTAANWHFQALAGAGAVLSTIDDMALLVQHYLQATAISASEPVSSPALADAMRLSVTSLLSDPAVGYGWMLHPRGLVWHNGQTAGFNAFVGFAPAEQVGIVILSNSSIPVTPGGMALLQQLQQPQQLPQHAGVTDNELSSK
ncbi:serine hydrolase domain-containing protein [Arsukibacterium indicum]|uniref:Beta-lactamase family protein n=1 Tax=Arsukibacterium indicum TaxID=2848612 RepID=A0ABS6MLR0_9GAMM|nr:serine hydrolase domain-containing protein [Arsukibacterium indicum]MBV2129756.1 beta-lactamase family protein [Arsukibacterium indicum]